MAKERIRVPVESRYGSAAVVVCFVVFQLSVCGTILFKRLRKPAELASGHIDVDVVIPRDKAVMTRSTNDRAAGTVVCDLMLSAESIDFF